MKRHHVLKWAIPALVIALFMTAVSTFAGSQITATSVALNPRSGCDQAALDLGFRSDGSVEREGGIVSTDTGLVLSTFDQISGLDGFPFDGVVFDYGLQAWDSDDDPPPGTVMGLYAFIGKLPYSSTTTVEWFLAYVCDTREVVYTCFGDYGTCPQTVTDITGTPTPTPVTPTPETPTPEMLTPTAPAQAVNQPCPNPLPSSYRVFSVPNGARAHFAPRADTYAGFNLPAGTWYVSPEDDSGFAGVWITCHASRVFIPEDNIAR